MDAGCISFFLPHSYSSIMLRCPRSFNVRNGLAPLPWSVVLPKLPRLFLVCHLPPTGALHGLTQTWFYMCRYGFGVVRRARGGTGTLGLNGMSGDCVHYSKASHQCWNPFLSQIWIDFMRWRFYSSLFLHDLFQVIC